MLDKVSSQTVLSDRLVRNTDLVDLEFSMVRSGNVVMGDLERTVYFDEGLLSVMNEEILEVVPVVGIDVSVHAQASGILFSN